MSKEMVISANPHETRVAILEEGQLCEYYVEREKEFALVGSIYKGKVTRVLPGMQSAFVEIGLDSDAFLYVSDFMEEIEELDHVVTTVEDKAQKMEEQGGQVFPANTGTAPIIEPIDVESPRVSAAAAPGVAAGLEPLPGESISALRGPSAPGTFSPAVSRPSGGGHGSDRGRFENRSRGGRPGGDRSGRFGRRGGSSGGRGRSGGGGRPGGDRGGRFGRELPSSKYASSRAPEDHASEPGAPEGHISTLLPGESLAKFRERGPSDIPASTAQTHLQDVATAPSDMPAFEPHESPAHESEAHGNVQEDVSEDAREGMHDSAAPSRSEEQPAESRRGPAARESSGRGSFPARESFPRRNEGFRAPSSSGLEPLPGETLSKWKAHTHLPPEPLAAEPQASEPQTHQPQDNSPVPDAVRFAPLSPLMPAGPEVDSLPTPDAHVEEPGVPNSRDWNQVEALSPNFELSDAPEVHEHQEGGHHDEHPHVDLTEEEAAALAEHIADAQDDDAARDAQNRVFAAADAAADAGVHEDHSEHGDHHEHETEEHLDEEHAEDAEEAELEQEEAAAEEEGMIAPPEPESEHEHADGPESIAAQGENGGANSAEGSQPPAQQPSQARVRGDFRSRMQNPARRGGRDRGGRRDDRGRRPQHGHSGGHSHGRPQQPRRTQLIADMLKQGQEIIVQIAKEPLGKKGARITSHVALPGRFLVYMPTLDHTGVSRKIASAEERARLRHLVTDAKGSSGGGFIVRTAAASAAPDEVRADVEFLTRTWSEIKARSEQRKAPSLLHRDLNLVERILRDYITPDFGAIWVDTEEEYTKVVDFMSRFQPQLVGRVKLYTKETPVFEEFGIQQEIDKGLRPKVWLKSGGYIVINHTEALVAIDVNTGKFVGKGSNRLEDTIVRTNLEACKEIVRQMRLRDLGGIIIIDFIDMEERRNREKVMAVLEDALRADRAPSKVLRFNEFGLVAITRKRTKQALERTLCQPCPYCTGSGMVKSIPTLCYEIQTEARKMAPEVGSGSITLRVHPEISKALKTRESSLIEELERWTKKSIIIQADPTLHWEQYDIY
ncbi:MAG TPA: Rne/Rng family ribonuclease [Candidatus Acidoferrales bacterium]|nr:Rne/Rng family ribonuclease [Candidatus Acidoferrales bacterium]